MNLSRDIRGKAMITLLVILCLCVIACKKSVNTPKIDPTEREERGDICISASKYTKEPQDSQSRRRMEQIKRALELRFSQLYTSERKEDKEIVKLMDRQYCNYIVVLNKLLSLDDSFSKEVSSVLQEQQIEYNDVSDMAIKICHRNCEGVDEGAYQVTVLQKKKET